MSSTRNPTTAEQSEYEDEYPEVGLPEEIKHLTPGRARQLIVECGWPVRKFMDELDASAADVTQYLSTHGLTDLADENRKPPCTGTGAAVLDDMNIDEFDDLIGGDDDE